MTPIKRRESNILEFPAFKLKCSCISPKPFRLSSDAVLKGVEEYKSIELDIVAHRNNLSESSKIVIAEGYYE